MNSSRLALSGGGPRGLGLLGALHYIDENHGLDNITEYWGSSIGSVLCLLLSIGYSPFDVFQQFFIMDKLVDNTLQLPTAFETTALCPIEIFGDKVRTFIEQKIPRDSQKNVSLNLTFSALFNLFHKKIHIIGANADTMKGECFDVDTRPNMSVIEAIEISCDLPYIFTKKMFEGHTYVDGGFINNYPIDMADDGIHKVLGICVFGDMSATANDYVGWIYRLLQIPVMQLHREHIQRLSKECVNIELTINGISLIEMIPTIKKKLNIFSEGYKQGKTFFEAQELAGMFKPDGWGFKDE